MNGFFDRSTHRVRVYPEGRRWFASCSCVLWVEGPFKTQDDAQKAARRHMKAVEAWCSEVVS